MWRGWDVHAYSHEWAPAAAQLGVAQADAGQLRRAKVEIAAMFPFLGPVLQRIQLTQDADLANLDPGSLLVATWDAVRKANDPGTFRCFAEIVTDIGTTCLQGQTHRLAALLAAFRD
jgi:hypothetical protein